MTQIMKSTKLAAAGLGDYNLLGIQELADGYCDAVDAGNEIKKEQYMAALILKFWYQQGRMYSKCRNVTINDADDYYYTLYCCIENAMQYRAWRDTSKNTNAQACINRSIAARGTAEILYQSNLDKGKANVNTTKLDAPLDLSDFDSDLRIDKLADPNAVEKGSVAVACIQTMIDKAKVLEAVILDTIAFNDTVKVETSVRKEIDIDTGEEYKVTDSTAGFWRYKAVQYLADLPSDYVKYFTGKYRIADFELNAILDKIRKTNNQKLYKYVDSTLLTARNIGIGTDLREMIAK